MRIILKDEEKWLTGAVEETLHIRIGELDIPVDVIGRVDPGGFPPVVGQNLHSMVKDGTRLTRTIMAVQGMAFAARLSAVVELKCEHERPWTITFKGINSTLLAEIS